MKVLECLVELSFPDGRFERFSIPVIKRMNRFCKSVKGKFAGRRRNVLVKLWVGRDVTVDDVKNYLHTYFLKCGLWKYVTRFQLA